MVRLVVLAMALGGCGNKDEDGGPTDDTDVTTGDTDTDTHTTDTDTDAGVHTDVYEQIGRSPVDLLIVVDNTKGMTPYQEALAQAYPSLVQPYFDQGIDFHVGVISTDVRDPAQSGNLRTLPDGTKFITKDTPDPQGAFTAAVSIGQAGSSPSGLRALLMATDAAATPGNAGFLRPEARLEMLVVSDHDDEDPTLDAQDTATTFWSLKADPPRVRLSAATMFPNCACQGTEVPGLKYALIQVAMSGDVYDLLSPTWQTDLASIPARNDAKLAAFGLSGYPDPATIALEIHEADGDVVVPTEDAWEYVTATDVSAIVFSEGNAPDYDSELVVTWTAMQ